MPKQKARKVAIKRTKRGKPRSGEAKAEELSLTGREELLQPGPRKKRAKGGVVRLTNHKARSRWFQTRSSWPVREAPVHRLVRERARVEKALAAPPALTSQWECVGPTNIGGRIT